jgi:hypothetical protein
VALVYGVGNLMRFQLLPDQRHDSVGAEPLLDGIEIGALIADKGFDNDARRHHRHPTQSQSCEADCV